MLYRAAKADPGRRFHALYDKVCRRDVLQRAWEQVRDNRGAAGIDRVTVQLVEAVGVDGLLDELATDLKDGRYRPLPARRVNIPKPGTNERRPLSIPAVRDRIVQAALKIVIEPVFEADFADCSYGFRPKRSAHDALQVLLDESWQGRRVIAETDIANCFEAIPHSKLIGAVAERISDRKVLQLLRAMLRAGVMQNGMVQRRSAGTPQGGVISPLLCNVYLHRLDRAWQEEHGRLVRYCDDLVVVCSTFRQAETAMARLRLLLAELGLEPKEAKTRTVRMREGEEGVDFLGFHHRLVRLRIPSRSRRRIVFLARWPSRKATQRARDRIRQVTARSRLRVPTEDVVQELNWFLRGWAGYFRFGNSARVFTTIRTYALERLALFVAKRHKRDRRWGMARVAVASPNQFGLVRLDGIVVSPRARVPTRPWKVYSECRR